MSIVLRSEIRGLCSLQCNIDPSVVTVVSQKINDQRLWRRCYIVLILLLSHMSKNHLITAFASVKATGNAKDKLNYLGSNFSKCSQMPNATHWALNRDVTFAGRQGKDWNEVDTRDDSRITAHLWKLLQAGRIEEAKSVCHKCGQSWRATTLGGPCGPRSTPLGSQADKARILLSFELVDQRWIDRLLRLVQETEGRFNVTHRISLSLRMLLNYMPNAQIDSASWRLHHP